MCSDLVISYYRKEGFENRNDKYNHIQFSFLIFIIKSKNAEKETPSQFSPLALTTFQRKVNLTCMRKCFQICAHWYDSSNGSYTLVGYVVFQTCWMHVWHSSNSSVCWVGICWLNRTGCEVLMTSCPWSVLDFILNWMLLKWEMMS